MKIHIKNSFFVRIHLFYEIKMSLESRKTHINIIKNYNLRVTLYHHLRNREGSFQTAANRKQILNRTFQDIVELGFIINDVKQLKLKHVTELIKSWKEQNIRACPQFILRQIIVQAILNIDLKFLANFSKRVAILRKCFSFAKTFSTKCLIL